MGYIKISDDRIEVYDDHIEIKLTGRDLNGADGRDKGADGSILHFWGKDVNVNGNEVLGLVASYTVWVKEPEYVGKLAATIVLTGGMKTVISVSHLPVITIW